MYFFLLLSTSFYSCQEFLYFLCWKWKSSNSLTWKVMDGTELLLVIALFLQGSLWACWGHKNEGCWGGDVHIWNGGLWRMKLSLFPQFPHSFLSFIQGNWSIIFTETLCLGWLICLFINRQLVKLTKICKCRINIYCSKWLSGMTTISRSILQPSGPLFVTFVWSMPSKDIPCRGKICSWSQTVWKQSRPRTPCSRRSSCWQSNFNSLTRWLKLWSPGLSTMKSR